MDLKSLMVDTKSAWINCLGFEGFEVEVAAVGRDKIVALRKSCVTTKFDRRTGLQSEELDQKKFVRRFTEECVRSWRGLKLTYLEQLMLVDIQSQNPDAELPYSQDNAELLVNNSTDFDNWLNEAVFDLDNFRTKRDGGTVESSE